MKILTLIAIFFVTGFLSSLTFDPSCNEGSLGGVNFFLSSAQAQAQKCPSGTYPNGSNCYPCLGCHPCPSAGRPNDFCDNNNAFIAIKPIPTFGNADTKQIAMIDQNWLTWEALASVGVGALNPCTKYYGFHSDDLKSHAHFCEINPNGPLAAIRNNTGLPNLLLHSVNHPDAQGILSVALGTPLNSFLKIGDNGAGCTAIPGFATCEAIQTLVPTVAVSEVDPGQFQGQNVPTGFTEAQLNTAITNFGATGTKAAFAQIFGVTVTTKLYKALQTAQFPGNKSCSPTGASYDTAPSNSKFATGRPIHANGDSQACMPSLTSGQIASILTGKITDWSQLFIGTKASAAFDGHIPGATPLPNLANLPASLIPGSTHVHICSMRSGSGALATMGIKRLNYPSSPSATAPVLATPANTVGSFVESLGVHNVHQMGSADDVAECMTELNDHMVDDGTAFTSGYLDDRWAIAYQSTANNANLVEGYKFIKINGIAPTQQNVANGSYKDWVEATVNALPLANGGDADSITIQNYIASLSPTNIGNLNNDGVFYGCPGSAFIAGNVTQANVTPNPLGSPTVLNTPSEPGLANHCWGQAGFMASGSTNSAQAQGLLGSVAQEYYSNAPINPLSHASMSPGSTINNSRQPVLFGGTPKGLQLK